MNSPDSNSPQAIANKRIGAHVPRYAWDSTVAIVVAHRPAVHLLGTGSLFQIADRSFVVTAAHVIRLAHAHDKTIGISGDANSLISVHGDWITTTSSSEEDPFDVAVYPLPGTAVQRLSLFRFVRLNDISFDEQSKDAIFTLFGHPGIWSSPSEAEGATLQVKGLEYTAIAYERGVESLTGYRPEYHLLLDAQAQEVTQADGARMVFKNQAGGPVVFPRDLKGISGCPAWRIGDSKVPIDDWHRLPPKVVGVQTGVYQPSQVIRVTRWVAVTTLIDAAFPELRPAMKLIR